MAKVTIYIALCCVRIATSKVDKIFSKNSPFIPFPDVYGTYSRDCSLAAHFSKTNPSFSGTKKARKTHNVLFISLFLTKIVYALHLLSRFVHCDFFDFYLFYLHILWLKLKNGPAVDIEN